MMDRKIKSNPGIGPGASLQLHGPFSLDSSGVNLSSQFTISSHNIQGRSQLVELYFSKLNSGKGANEIILLQDVGIEAKKILFMLSSVSNSVVSRVNFSPTNSSRSVAILVGRNWKILETFNDEKGSAIGVLLSRGKSLIACFSAYLPPGLDNIGSQHSTRLSPHFSVKDKVQHEANNTYCTLKKWIGTLSPFVNWLIGGDLNETRSALDRTSYSSKSYQHIKKDKFVEEFLSVTQGMDVWNPSSLLL
jgi:hypothetical protein